MTANEPPKRAAFASRYQDGMIFVRFLALILLAGALLLPARAAVTSARPPLIAVVHAGLDGGDEDQDDRQTHARARGVVSGLIVGVDYAYGTLRLQTAHGVLDITILPGTSIVRRKDEYGTIADLARGTRVEVYVSQIAGGRLFAQLIRIH